MIGRALDSLIGIFAPAWGLNRIAARATMDQIANFSGAGKGGYAAGKLNRLHTLEGSLNIKENAQPSAEIERMRGRRWDLWRNNAYARKIVRSITSKVVGGGMTPQSAAMNDDGTPNTEFRNRAKQLWAALQSNFDFRGRPGMGGLDTIQLAKTALKAVVIGGECLWMLRAITKAEMESRGLPIPYVLQLVDATRLGHLNSVATPSELPDGHSLYRGIELDKDGRRVAYHLYSFPIGAVTPITVDAQIIPSDQMGHLFVEDDIDQLRGVSWFSAALDDSRDIQDYRYNELKSSAMASCVVLGYTRSTGSTSLGLNTPAGGSSTDADGNQAVRMQPGMVVNLGKDGKLEGFNPGRDSSGVEGFAQFMVRGVASSMPGTKASTVTGDYRNSSFSSERSADNDCWPEMQEVQDWFSSSFYQPIWDRVLAAAVMVGYFDGVVTAAEFAANRANYTRATWQGPIAKSINPKDDAESASLRVQGLLSSVQAEAAAVGADWRENLVAMAEVYKVAEGLAIPEDVIDKVYGLNVTETAMAEPENESGEDAATQNQDTEAESDTENTSKGGVNVTQAA